MKRRTLLVALAALPLARPALAGFDTGVNYTPGLVDDLLAEGKTVFVDFSASWCSTCKSQAQTINAFRSANPEYDSKVSFVSVDWDTYESDPLTLRLNIPRRSTLVVLKGDAELGRIVAGTAKDEIKALMDTALQAAVA